MDFRVSFQCCLLFQKLFRQLLRKCRKCRKTWWALWPGGGAT